MKSLFNVLKALKAAIIFLVQILTSDTAKRQRNGVGKCMSANWNTSKLGQRFQLDLGLTGFSKGSIYLTIKIALYCNGFFSFKIVTRWIALLFVLDPVCWPDSTGFTFTFSPLRLVSSFWLLVHLCFRICNSFPSLSESTWGGTDRPGKPNFATNSHWKRHTSHVIQSASQKAIYTTEFFWHGSDKNGSARIHFAV